MINILFFGQLKEVLACNQLQLDVDTKMQVQDVHQILIEKYEQWASYLQPDRILVAVNQTMASMEHQVNDGDEIAFFPPVTGG